MTSTARAVYPGRSSAAPDARGGKEEEGQAVAKVVALSTEPGGLFYLQALDVRTVCCPDPPPAKIPEQLLFILADIESPLTLGSSGLYSAPSSALRLVRARPCADVAMAP